MLEGFNSSYIDYLAIDIAEDVDHLLRYGRRIELPLKRFDCNDIDGTYISIPPDFPFRLVPCRVVVEYKGVEILSPLLPLEFVMLLFGVKPKDLQDTDISEKGIDSKIELEEVATIPSYQLFEQPWIVLLVDPDDPINYFIDLEASAENLLRSTWEND